MLAKSRGTGCCICRITVSSRAIRVPRSIDRAPSPGSPSAPSVPARALKAERQWKDGNRTSISVSLGVEVDPARLGVVPGCAPCRRPRRTRRGCRNAPGGRPGRVRSGRTCPNWSSGCGCPGGTTGSAERAPAGIGDRHAPKRSSVATWPAAVACSCTARPQVTTRAVSGWRWRPAQSSARRASSVAEQCGLPRATRLTSAESAPFSSHQLSSRSARLTRSSRVGAWPPRALATSGASGVTPAIWNMGAAEVVAKAAPKALRSSVLARCAPAR